MSLIDEHFAKEFNHRLAKTPSLTAAGLAELFKHCFFRQPLSDVLLHSLQAFLLKRTVAHARLHTRFYCETSEYSEFKDTEYGHSPDLSCWPVLSRSDVIERFSDFIADDVCLRSICHTSGTTGAPLNVYKSFEEIDFVYAYYSALLHPFTQTCDHLPVTLSFPNLYHGVPVPLPSLGLTLTSGVTDDTLIEDAVRVLTAVHKVPGYGERVSIITGLAHHVLFFTNYLLEKGISPSSLHMQAINITGGYISPHWRDFLTDSWRTVVNDRFTLTETIGGASRCHNCGYFHLDPQIIGEVIDVDTREPIIDEAIGELVLTNLYPFVQMQPLLRYRTGDLVRRVLGECSPGLTFEFLGKVKNCVGWQRDGHREWLVFSAKLHDILSGEPDVHIYDWFSNVRLAKDRTIGSLPIFSSHSELENGRMKITLRIEMRYSPHFHASRIDKFRAQCISTLRKVPNTALARRLDSGEAVLQIDLTGPDTLREPIVIKI